MKSPQDDMKNWRSPKTRSTRIAVRRRSVARREEAAPELDRPSNSQWGGLMKTLATKSESVLETYRHDLQEFGLGLRKEIQVAQGLLEDVGQAIDELGSSVLKGTGSLKSVDRDS
ncbi:hypothetical protein NL676_008110 [Syzygium grande]|nr:hypothetical protein NL676_008110 [Syzygium grande]